MREGVTYKRLNEVCCSASSNVVINKVANDNGDYPLFGASGLVKNVSFYHRNTPYIGIIKDGAGVGRVNRYPAYSSLVGTLQYIIPNNEVCSIDYIYYVLKHMDLGHSFTGATIPHIYFKDYGKTLIPVPSLEEQQRIVSELDRLASIISDKQQQLHELDNLAQAIFYNMFGDKTLWDNATLPDVCQSIVRGPFGSALKKEFFVEKSNDTYKVYEQKHAINKNAEIGSYYITEEKFKSLKRFEVIPHDIIMSCSGTIGELFEIPEGSERGIMNQALLKFRINNARIERTFFLYVMDYVKNEMTIQGSGLQNIGSVKEICKIAFPLPPLDLQKQFAEKVKAIEAQKDVLKQSIAEFENLLAQRMELHFA